MPPSQEFPRPPWLSNPTTPLHVDLTNDVIPPSLSPFFSPEFSHDNLQSLPTPRYTSKHLSRDCITFLVRPSPCHHGPSHRNHHHHQQLGKNHQHRTYNTFFPPHLHHSVPLPLLFTTSTHPPKRIATHKSVSTAPNIYFLRHSRARNSSASSKKPKLHTRPRKRPSGPIALYSNAPRPLTCKHLPPLTSPTSTPSRLTGSHANTTTTTMCNATTMAGPVSPTDPADPTDLGVPHPPAPERP